MNSTVYIRKENEETWKAVENKSEWLNERLDHKTLVVSDRLVESELPHDMQKVIKDMSFCKHGVVKGFCKKGCK